MSGNVEVSVRTIFSGCAAQVVVRCGRKRGKEMRFAVRALTAMTRFAASTYSPLAHA